jgi:type III pantothenate kinase
MIFAVDIGNTHIVIGVYNGDNLINNCRLSADTSKTTDEYAATIMLLLKNRNISIDDITGVVISSVVPQLVYTFSKLSNKYFNVEPIVIGPGIKTGVPIKLENPKEVGADRIVNASAVIHYYGVPGIVVDFGTATTFDVINTKGEYVGGVITPGVKLSASILHSKTAKLPEVELERCNKVVGKSTISSIKSGIYFGYLSLIDGIIERIIKEEDLDLNEIKIVATGGLGSIFVESSKYLKIYEPHLTLNGLRLLYEKNS